MHQHLPGLARLDGGGIEITNPARKLGAVEVADAHHVARRKVSLATRNTRRQEALAVFAKGLLGTVINEQRSLGVMEKSDPSFASRQKDWLRDKHRSLVLPLQNVCQHRLFLARSDDERYS